MALRFFRPGGGTRRAFLIRGQAKARARWVPMSERAAERRERLKAALRDNLRRRKAQARDRGETRDAPRTDERAKPDED